MQDNRDGGASAHANCFKTNAEASLACDFVLALGFSRLRVMMRGASYPHNLCRPSILEKECTE